MAGLLVLVDRPLVMGDSVILLFQLVWSYKHNLTMDFRFDTAASEICRVTLDQVRLLSIYLSIELI